MSPWPGRVILDPVVAPTGEEEPRELDTQELEDFLAADTDVALDLWEESQDIELLDSSTPKSSV